MKRFLSFMMALALLFSMSVNAFAFDDGKGSITITNATVDNVYTLYKIFDASIAKDKDNNTVVAYSMEKTNQFYSYMFNTDGTAKEGNVYFVYNTVTGAITLNPEVNEEAEKTAMFAYLKEMIKTGKKADDTAFTAADTKTAESQTVVFEGLEYGYYLIYKGAEAAVTIDSNTPNVEVIDKNQIPVGLTKEIYDEDFVGANGEIGKWVDLTSANVGDTEEFKINFIATNYHGDEPIKYYTVLDEYDNALQVNFESFEVKVGNTNLTKGYYHNISETVDDKYVGEWGDETKDADSAQYYIIHTAEGKFKVVIPWMTNHDFTGINTEDGFTMAFNTVNDVAPTSIYDATESVEITYSAVVKDNAEIGANGTNLENKADLEWVYGNETGEGEEDKTDIKVYALGLNKVEQGTTTPLAGAQFTVYRDAECTKPIYVRPTDNPNIYIYDSENKTESNTNVVTTDATGKIVIIGLEQGTYYLKEVKAPDGYNRLPDNTSVKLGSGEGTSGNETFFDKYVANTATVENSKGIELPSTGGEGTMRMITIGSIVAIAFAVLLITNKKMSVYQD